MSHRSVAASLEPRFDPNGGSPLASRLRIDLSAGLRVHLVHELRMRIRELAELLGRIDRIDLDIGVDLPDEA